MTNDNVDLGSLLGEVLTCSQRSPSHPSHHQPQMQRAGPEEGEPSSQRHGATPQRRTRAGRSGRAPGVPTDPARLGHREAPPSRGPGLEVPGLASSVGGAGVQAEVRGWGGVPLMLGWSPAPRHVPGAIGDTNAVVVY